LVKDTTSFPTGYTPKCVCKAKVSISEYSIDYDIINEVTGDPCK
jgi:hypothetical protein